VDRGDHAILPILRQEIMAGPDYKQRRGPLQSPDISKHREHDYISDRLVPTGERPTYKAKHRN